MIPINFSKFENYRDTIYKNEKFTKEEYNYLNRYSHYDLNPIPPKKRNFFQKLFYSDVKEDEYKYSKVSLLLPLVNSVRIILYKKEDNWFLAEIFSDKTRRSYFYRLDGFDEVKEIIKKFIEN